MNSLKAKELLHIKHYQIKWLMKHPNNSMKYQRTEIEKIHFRVNHKAKRTFLSKT
jgi:hypothetical protein